MNKKYALYIILGVIIGALFGVSFVPVIETDALGVLGGALAGGFVGWFIAAARERSVHANDTEKSNSRITKEECKEERNA